MLGLKLGRAFNVDSEPTERIEIPASTDVVSHETDSETRS